MKKYIAWILLLAVLTMAGCHFANTEPTTTPPSPDASTAPPLTSPSTGVQVTVPSEPTDPPPTETQVTIPTISTEPTDPIVLGVAMFQELFEARTAITFWNMALCQAYDDARMLNLVDLFYNGCPIQGERATAQERKELETMLGKEIEADINRCIPAEMNQVLTELFGLTLEDFGDDALKSFLYLESTGCYYLLRSDVLYAHKLNVVDFHELENGNVEVYYSVERWTNMNGVVTLKPSADGYHILSNSFAEAPN